MVCHFTAGVVQMLPMAVEDEEAGYSFCHLCEEDLCLGMYPGHRGESRPWAGWDQTERERIQVPRKMCLSCPLCSSS